MRFEGVELLGEEKALAERRHSEVNKIMLKLGRAQSTRTAATVRLRIGD
jgi:hypothetical protein